MIRTCVSALRGRRPRPLVERTILVTWAWNDHAPLDWESSDLPLSITPYWWRLAESNRPFPDWESGFLTFRRKRHIKHGNKLNVKVRIYFFCFTCSHVIIIPYELVMCQVNRYLSIRNFCYFQHYELAVFMDFFFASRKCFFKSWIPIFGPLSYLCLCSSMLCETLCYPLSLLFNLSLFGATNLNNT